MLFLPEQRLILNLIAFSNLMVDADLNPGDKNQNAKNVPKTKDKIKKPFFN